MLQLQLTPNENYFCCTDLEAAILDSPLPITSYSMQQLDTVVCKSHVGLVDN